jgi:hypothetical protein
VFSPDETFLVCPDTISRETFTRWLRAPHGQGPWWRIRPSDSFQLPRRENSSTGGWVWRTWEEYCQRKLTKEADALFAFQALLSRIPCRSYFGVLFRPLDEWSRSLENAFCQGLAWHNSANYDRHVPSTRVDYPSWSWLSSRSKSSAMFATSDILWKIFAASISLEQRKTSRLVPCNTHFSASPETGMIERLSPYIHITSVTTSISLEPAIVSSFEIRWVDWPETMAPIQESMSTTYWWYDQSRWPLLCYATQEQPLHATAVLLTFETSDFNGRSRLKLFWLALCDDFTEHYTRLGLITCEQYDHPSMEEVQRMLDDTPRRTLRVG